MKQNKQGRYLTPKEKGKELYYLYQHLDLLDDGILSYLEKLNEFVGVCTVQSCLGHVAKLAHHKEVQNGCIEFRLDEKCTNQFWEAMPYLKSFDWCEDVTFSWRPGYQIAQIIFEPGTIALAVNALLEIFEMKDET